MPDGRIVAVKVQYPGVDKAIKSDLDNAELLYGLFAQFALKNLDVKALVDELRARMADELDYRLEAACQEDFAVRYEGHPFIRVPHVVPERSASGCSPASGSTACGGTSSSTPPTRRLTTPARCSCASRRAPSTATACSTATPTRATTASIPTTAR